MNMIQSIQTQQGEIVAGLLQAIDQPARLEILRVLGSGEACVCHLEAALGQRQAYISQHLMALRDAGIITSRRAGRYVFYRINDVRVLDLISLAGSLAGVPPIEPSISHPVQDCLCPHCTGAVGTSLKLE
jgi:DNA-binding transcriptional ArsR family regulator